MIDAPDYNGFVQMPVNPKSGWANIPMAEGSNFDPDIGEKGPWCWMPSGPAEVVCGGGMPLKNHISTFIVWQAMYREEYEKKKVGAYAYNLPYRGLSYPVHRRVSHCALYFGLQIRRLTQLKRTQERPTYVVRDLFTVLMDSDCMDASKGKPPSWAAKEYDLPRLKTQRGTNSASLYAAVRSRDGILLPASDIAFARDNYDALRTDDADDRILRKSDRRSRWARLDVPRNDVYHPVRGRTGIWSWAPVDAAEAIIGGGIPFGKHLLVFAIWDEVV